jgi:hypothetical protein
MSLVPRRRGRAEARRAAILPEETRGLGRSLRAQYGITEPWEAEDARPSWWRAAGLHRTIAIAFVAGLALGWGLVWLGQAPAARPGTAAAATSAATEELTTAVRSAREAIDAQVARIPVSEALGAVAATARAVPAWLARAPEHAAGAARAILGGLGIERAAPPALAPGPEPASTVENHADTVAPVTPAPAVRLPAVAEDPAPAERGPAVAESPSPAERPASDPPALATDREPDTLPAPAVAAPQGVAGPPRATARPAEPPAPRPAARRPTATTPPLSAREAPPAEPVVRVIPAEPRRRVPATLQPPAQPAEAPPPPDLPARAPLPAPPTALPPRPGAGPAVSATSPPAPGVGALPAPPPPPAPESTTLPRRRLGADVPPRPAPSLPPAAPGGRL